MTALEASRRHAPLVRLSATLALAAVLLFGALVLRSTETWISGDPTTVRRLLDLRAEQRELTRRWETAQRGDARFELDTEIRVVAARIDDLEQSVRQPRRTHGGAPWSTRAMEVPAFAARVATTLLLAGAAVVLALAAASALRAASSTLRRIGLGLCLAPLVLPPPLFAEAIRRLAAGLGLAPSPVLAAVAALTAGAAAALIVLLTLRGDVDRRRLDAAHDLGLPKTTILATLVLPTWAPALAFALVTVFARLFGDLSIARLTGEASARSFGEWLRYRIVAVVDYPGAAVGAIATAVAVTLLAALVAVLARRRLVSSGPAHPSSTGLRLPPVPPTLAIAAAVLIGVALATADTGLLAAPALAGELLAVLARWARAGLAAAVALTLAAAVARRLDHRPVERRRSVLTAALFLTALPTPVTGLALVVTAGDLGVPIGSWIAVAASATAAFGPTLALLLLAAPLDAGARSARPSLDLAALRIRHGPRLPLAALLAFALALAGGDVAAVLGFDGRPRPWPVPPGAGLPLVLGFAGLALAFGLACVAALERAGFDRTRSRGIEL